MKNNNLIKLGSLQIKLGSLQSEKRNLLLALEDFKKGYKAAFTSYKVRKAFKMQIQLVNARIIEFDRVLSILEIKL